MKIFDISEKICNYLNESWFIKCCVYFKSCAYSRIIKNKESCWTAWNKALLLPPYLPPSLALTKWIFGVSKKRLSSQKKMRTIYIIKQRGKTKIIECLNMIERNFGVRIWMQFFKSITKYIEVSRFVFYSLAMKQRTMKKLISRF